MFARHASAFSVLVFLLALVACSDRDIQLPKVFGNEVPPDVLNEPRLVPSPPPPLPTDQRQWPLLGAVPSKPKDFTPQPTIDAAKAQMENDRNHAESLQQEYQAAPPIIPAAPQEP